MQEYKKTFRRSSKGELVAEIKAMTASVRGTLDKLESLPWLEKPVGHQQLSFPFMEGKSLLTSPSKQRKKVKV